MCKKKEFINRINKARCTKMVIHHHLYSFGEIKIIRAVKDMYSTNKVQLFTSNGGIVTVDITSIEECPHDSPWIKYQCDNLQLLIA